LLKFRGENITADTIAETISKMLWFFKKSKSQLWNYENAIYEWALFSSINEKKANRKPLFLWFAIYLFGYLLRESSKKANRIPWLIRMRFTIHSNTASKAFKMIIAFTGKADCDLLSTSLTHSTPRHFPKKQP
jgi:hypothetical protein